MTTNDLRRSVHVVFCDTGVENPVVAGFVRYVFRRTCSFAREHGLPISTHILRPGRRDSFWFKVIGRGCPPPTNRFRWCTDKLRVKPLRDFCKRNCLTNATTILGVRRGESHQRDRTMETYDNGSGYLRYYDSNTSLYYCPICDYSDADVWSCLSDGSVLGNGFFRKLARIYGMNAIHRDDTPVSNGQRMGCWVCTVVRKDRSAEDLIGRGYDQLRPYLQFRDWLSHFRDDPIYRCRRRRNGGDGPGPITLEGRKLILARLLKLQAKVRRRLIPSSEIAAIYREWRIDCQVCRVARRTR